MTARPGRWRWVSAAELLASPVHREEPLDARPLAVATLLPLRDLGDQRGLAGDPAIEALADHDPDLDLHHVEPARVLRREVELETAQNAPGFRRCKALVEGGR